MSNKIQLYCDIQFMQTGAYNRGMGYFFKGLMSAMLKSENIVKVVFIYSSNLPKGNIKRYADHINANTSKTETLFVEKNLITHDPSKDNYKKAFESNKTTIDKYFNKETSTNNKLIWLIPSLMQEPCIAVFPSNDKILKTIIWYDLMPYLFSKQHFLDNNSAYARAYLSRLNLLPECEAVFSISLQTKNDLIEYLSIPENRIHVINGSINQELLTLDDEAILQDAQPYFLCPASPEPNKNIINTIEGFNQFNIRHNNKYSLVITSEYNDKIAKEYKNKNILFTGHINTEELIYLYKHCEGLLFGSRYEGLGMPILEAVRFGKKIICSDIEVFKEISPRKVFYYFNPDSPEEIAIALNESCKKSTLNEAEYEVINNKYTWDNSAQYLLAKIINIKPRQKPIKKIAVVGPHPSSFSAIAKIIVESYPLISEKYVLDYYFDSGPSDKRHGLVHFNYMSEYKNLMPIAHLLNASSNYSEIIYHMGNSDHHMKSYLMLHKIPGITIIHDTDLSGNGLVGQMLNNAYLSEERKDLELLIEREYLKKPERFIASLISSQKKVVVHSDHARQVVDDYTIGHKRSIKTNLPISVAQRNYRKTGKNITIGMGGIISDAKGIDFLSWLFKNTNDLEGFELVIFGFGFFTDKKKLEKLADKHSNIRLYYDLSDYEFTKIMSNIDLLLNYRNIYKGETSRSTIEALRNYAIPIVRNTGWYSEIPNSVCFKLDNISELPSTLINLEEIGIVEARKILKGMAEKGYELLNKKYQYADYIKIITGN